VEPPPIPPGLEARLLAVGPQGRRRWTPIAAAVAAAAVVLAAMLPLRRHVPVATTQPAGPAVRAAPQPQTDTRSTRSQETRPCDIFPPLPPPL
jgi:hypothetical protein